MGARPASQQGPEAFHRVNMNFTKAIAIIISGILAGGVIHALVFVAPFTQPVVNGVLIGIDQCPWCYGGFYQRFNGYLPNIGKHSDHDLSATLDHPEYRWFLFFQCSSAWRTS
jgi:hypothetical protein